MTAQQNYPALAALRAEDKPRAICYSTAETHVLLSAVLPVLFVQKEIFQRESREKTFLDKGCL